MAEPQQQELRRRSHDRILDSSSSSEEEDEEDDKNSKVRAVQTPSPSIGIKRITAGLGEAFEMKPFDEINLNDESTPSKSANLRKRERSRRRSTDEFIKLSRCE